MGKSLPECGWQWPLVCAAPDCMKSDAGRKPGNTAESQSVRQDVAKAGLRERDAQSDRHKAERGQHVVCFHLDVWREAAVTAVLEKSLAGFHVQVLVQCNPGHAIEIRGGNLRQGGQCVVLRAGQHDGFFMDEFDFKVCRIPKSIIRSRSA